MSDGYYTIKSANSSGAYYLGVENDSIDNNTSIVLRTGSVSDGMKWKVTVASGGAYKITPKTGETNDRVLAVGAYAANVNGIDIQQRDYVNDDNYKDEWYIEEEIYRLSIIGRHTGSLIFAIQTKGELANNSTWSPLISTSITNWNTAVSSNIASTTTSSNYTIEVGLYSFNWLGMTTLIDINGETISSAEIEINASALSSNTFERESTITHEIGHLLGLADNPPVASNLTLMSHSRIRTLIYTPQIFDINNVKLEYSNH